jgi:hypothetical protein
MTFVHNGHIFARGLYAVRQLRDQLEMMLDPHSNGATEMEDGQGHGLSML